MKTAEQRKHDFLAELKQLMEKHGAELQLTDNGKPYGMHSPLVLLLFESSYTEDGDVILEYGDFELDSLYL